MKKKILAVALCVAMLSIAVLSGTLAYLQDDDADYNTFTVGNVTIVQNEEQRPVNDNGEYTDGTVIGFIDNSAIVPAVIVGTEEKPDTHSYDGTVTLGNGKTYNIWDESINNEIDKFITVTNTGTEEAYIRTILFFEDVADGSVTAKLHTLWGFNGDGSYVEKYATPTNGKYVSLPDADVVWLQDSEENWLIVKDEAGTLYTVAVITYTDEVKSKETTMPSLMQLWLDSSAGNEWAEAVGSVYEIHAVSLAVQADGFDSASQAMDTAYELTPATLKTWLDSSIVADNIKTDNEKNIVGGGSTTSDTTTNDSTQD